MLWNVLFLKHNFEYAHEHEAHKHKDKKFYMSNRVRRKAGGLLSRICDMLYLYRCIIYIYIDIVYNINIYVMIT